MLSLRAILQDPAADEGFIGHELSEDLEGPRRVYMRIVSEAEPLRIETPGLPSALRPEAFPDVRALPVDRLNWGTIGPSQGQAFRLLAARVPLPPRWGANEAVPQLAMDTSLDDEVLGRRLRRVLIALFGLAALVCAGAARLVVDRELKPLRQIAAAAAKTSTETLSYRIPLARLPAELRELARQFNDMLARLESRASFNTPTTSRTSCAARSTGCCCRARSRS